MPLGRSSRTNRCVNQLYPGFLSRRIRRGPGLISSKYVWWLAFENIICAAHGRRLLVLVVLVRTCWCRRVKYRCAGQPRIAVSVFMYTLVLPGNAHFNNLRNLFFFFLIFIHNNAEDALIEENTFLFETHYIFFSCN